MSTSYMTHDVTDAGQNEIDYNNRSIYMFLCLCDFLPILTMNNLTNCQDSIQGSYA